MFKRMKNAARQAGLEQSLRAVLKTAGVDAGAAITLREAGGGHRATIVLADSVTLSPEEKAALEQHAARLEGLSGVTLVTTGHQPRDAGNDAGPSPSAVRSAHDNPLSLPGKTQSARPEKARPQGAARVLAVASGKGGVGKSTVSAHLAVALAARGDRVGLLDLDIYGPSLPVMFDLADERPPLRDGMIVPLTAAGLSLMSIGFLVAEEKAVAWRGPMVMGAARQLLTEVAWPDLDWLVIDTPPGTGDAHLTLLQRTIVDAALLVSTPSPLAVADVRRGAALFEKMAVPVLGLVQNMASLPGGQPLFEAAGPSPLDLPVLATLPLDPHLTQLIGREAAGAPYPAFTALAETVRTRLADTGAAPGP